MEIVAPTPAYRDVADIVRWGLKDLGRPASIVSRPTGVGETIVLGAHWLRDSDWTKLAENAILYNLDPVGHGALWPDPLTLARFGRHRLWDYSRCNSDVWRRLGLSRVTFVPIGYADPLTRVDRLLAASDIDVLFYGSMSPRRAAMLDMVRDRGIHLVVRQNLWGRERDALVARSKLVLIPHFFEKPAIFEMARAVFLWANHKAVVAEVGPETEIDADLRSAVWGVPYPEIPHAIQWLLAHPEERQALECRAFDCITRRREADILETALSD
ncbi:MAG: hypothetical protein OWU33_09955 [Firmicutes bacterium]|nr:hypothetical protein [Bacillota bacterium]